MPASTGSKFVSAVSVTTQGEQLCSPFFTCRSAVPGAIVLCDAPNRAGDGAHAVLTVAMPTVIDNL